MQDARQNRENAHPTGPVFAVHFNDTDGDDETPKTPPEPDGTGDTPEHQKPLRDVIESLSPDQKEALRLLLRRMLGPRKGE